MDTCVNCGFVNNFKVVYMCCYCFERKSDLTQVEGLNIGREWPKITLVEVLEKKEVLIKKVIESMILDTIECWRRIHVNDFD